MADGIAARMAFFPWLIAGVSTLSWFTTQVNTIMDASLAATVVTHAASALSWPRVGVYPGNRPLFLRLKTSPVLRSLAVAGGRLRGR